MSGKQVKRITLFKVPNEDDIPTVLDQYAILRKNAVKDGKPYIVSNEAGKIVNASEERAQGYTVAVQTTFASMDDLKYYDQDCEAHVELKKSIRPVVKGVAVFYFESEMAA